MSRPANWIEPLLRTSRRSARPSVVLPDPLSPTTPDRVPFAHDEAHAVHRLDVADGAPQHPALDGEPDPQVPAGDDGRDALDGSMGLAAGLGFEQAACVGVLGAGEDLLGTSRLHDLALGHDAHAVGHFPDDAEVVGDEEERHPEPVAQVAQQAQDLGLDGDVEGGGRLVGDEEVGLVGERHRDHHALALAARQLVRIGAEPAGRLRQTDQAQQFQRPRPRRATAEPLVHEKHLVDLLLDRV